MDATLYLLVAISAGLSLAGCLLWLRARRALGEARAEVDARRKAHEEFDKRWVQHRARERKATMAEIVKLHPGERALDEDFRNRRKALARANPPREAAND